ncbi:hypothetical protein ACVBEH_27445, partial [Roseateles sp. GG27B]
SIEERMLELQARKQALADGVLGHDTAELAKFTAQDLALLLAPLAAQSDHSARGTQVDALR